MVISDATQCYSIDMLNGIMVPPRIAERMRLDHGNSSKWKEEAEGDAVWRRVILEMQKASTRRQSTSGMQICSR